MRVAVIQMTSSADVDRNLAVAERWIARAASAGVDLIALPENFAYLHDDEGDRAPLAQELDGPIGAFLCGQARRHSVWIAGGTVPERVPDASRHHNTALLIDADGKLAARYRKIHLFDVELPAATLRESETVAPGDEVVTAETPLGTIGLSVCYDLRFPELYRELADRGSRILLVPSAFTVPTGRDHWEVLLRARAIENQAFVVAAAQYGRHSRRRSSYGRSMVVDPWGTVLVTVPDGEGLGIAELDIAGLERIRSQLPALRHRRLRP